MISPSTLPDGTAYVTKQDSNLPGDDSNMTYKKHCLLRVGEYDDVANGYCCVDHTGLSWQVSRDFRTGTPYEGIATPIEHFGGGGVLVEANDRGEVVRFHDGNNRSVHSTGARDPREKHELWFGTMQEAREWESEVRAIASLAFPAAGKFRRRNDPAFHSNVERLYWENHGRFLYAWGETFVPEAIRVQTRQLEDYLELRRMDPSASFGCEEFLGSLNYEFWRRESEE